MDIRGSKLQEEANVDVEDFTTKYDGFVFRIKFIDYRYAVDLKTSNHTYPDYTTMFPVL